jgi:hypothetical protein
VKLKNLKNSKEIETPTDKSALNNNSYTTNINEELKESREIQTPTNQTVESSHTNATNIRLVNTIATILTAFIVLLWLYSIGAQKHSIWNDW